MSRGRAKVVRRVHTQIHRSKLFRCDVNRYATAASERAIVRRGERLVRVGRWRIAATPDHARGETQRRRHDRPKRHLGGAPMCPDACFRTRARGNCRRSLQASRFHPHHSGIQHVPEASGPLLQASMPLQEYRPMLALGCQFERSEARHRGPIQLDFRSAKLRRRAQHSACRDHPCCRQEIWLDIAIARGARESRGGWRSPADAVARRRPVRMRVQARPTHWLFPRLVQLVPMQVRLFPQAQRSATACAFADRWL